MRVTHVITRLIVGGAQENTIASVLGLHRRYHVDVRLISGPTTGPEGSLADQAAAVPGLLTILPSLVRPINPWLDALAWRRLVRLFRQDPPNIVHTHSGKAGFLGRVAARRAGVPVIVHTVHGPSFGNFQPELLNAPFRFAERLAGSFTTHFVTVADAMTRQYLAADIGAPQKYTCIHSGFDLQPFLSAKNDPQLRARYGIEPDDIVIGKIARLFKLKGHDDLFAAAREIVSRCPKAKFLLIGGGPWRDRFERRARELGLSQQFVFAGLVPPSQVPAFIGIMDLLVHLSQREGLARALPQALAAAKPVVAYDSDGSSEVCLDGQTGFLVQPGNPRLLIDRILRLAGDPALREQFGRRGRALVRESFSVDKMVQDIYALYRQLLSRTA
jgi:glycosyltransferase involved in cell wall biosynthesis